MYLLAFHPGSCVELLMEGGKWLNIHEFTDYKTSSPASTLNAYNSSNDDWVAVVESFERAPTKLLLWILGLGWLSLDESHCHHERFLASVPHTTSRLEQPLEPYNKKHLRSSRPIPGRRCQELPRRLSCFVVVLVPLVGSCWRLAVISSEVRRRIRVRHLSAISTDHRHIGQPRRHTKPEGYVS